MIDLVITFGANDRKGIVDAISQRVADLNGNWQQSRLIRLGGKFSGLIHVSIDETQLDELKTQLQSINDVTFQIDRIDQVQSELHTLAFTIFAHDRPGIVRELSALLSKMGINVLELNTNCESAPMSGEMVFAAELVVELPDGVDEEQLASACESLSDDLMIEFD